VEVSFLINCSDRTRINTIAGFGKSVLASTIVDYLKARSEDDQTQSQVVFFFCNQGDKDSNSTKDILDHILVQLYDQLNTLDTLTKANSAVTSYLELGDRRHTAFAETFAALTKISRSEKSLVSTLKSATQKPDSSIRLFISSRPESDVASALDDALEIKAEGNNERDIRHSTNALLAKMQGWTANERRLAEEAIVHKASGYFRYVELAIKFLSQPWKRPLSRRLEQLPEGIAGSYRHILQTIDPNYRELLRTALLFLVITHSPVTCTEVFDAFTGFYLEDQDPNEQVSDGENESPKLAPEREIDQAVDQLRFAGGSLLEVNSETGILNLRHITVADFFLKHNCPESTPSKPEQSGSLCANCAANLSDGAPPFTITEKDGTLELCIIVCKWPGRILARRIGPQTIPTRYRNADMQSYPTKC
jgi:hypothetical protein